MGILAKNRAKFNGILRQKSTKNDQTAEPNMACALFARIRYVIFYLTLITYLLPLTQLFQGKRVMYRIHGAVIYISKGFYVGIAQKFFL